MAKALRGDEEDERLAAERATVSCRFCGAIPVHFPPSGHPQTDAVCANCAPRAPWVTLVDSLSELTQPQPPPQPPPFRPAPPPRPRLDPSKENFT